MTDHWCREALYLKKMPALYMQAPGRNQVATFLARFSFSFKTATQLFPIVCKA